MKRVIFLLAAMAAPSLFGDSFPDAYASSGRLILTNLSSAPFPHPARVKGHSYDNQFFSAEQHYQDSTVGIFIPRDIRQRDKVDLVFHFHGWRNSVTNALRHYQLIEQLMDSHRDAVLV